MVSLGEVAALGALMAPFGTVEAHAMVTRLADLIESMTATGRELQPELTQALVVLAVVNLGSEWSCTEARAPRAAKHIHIELHTDLRATAAKTLSLLVEAVSNDDTAGKLAHVLVVYADVPVQDAARFYISPHPANQETTLDTVATTPDGRAAPWFLMSLPPRQLQVLHTTTSYAGFNAYRDAVVGVDGYPFVCPIRYEDPGI
jgi:hypothetical protein